MSCYSIDRGSIPDCESLPEGGTRARLILINYADVLAINEDLQGVITSIELNEGATAYEFLGFRNDVKKSEDVFKSRLKSRFYHKTGFVIYEIDQVQKNNIKKLCKGRVLAIVESKGKDENSIEVLGKNVGLIVQQGILRDAHNNSGLYVINLATPTNRVEFENKLPQNLGYTYDEGLSIIAGILGISADWILETGEWDDTGFWRDFAVWID